MSDEKNNNSLQLQFNEQTLSGNYANISVVSFTDTEFVFDFAFIQPANRGAAKVASRVIMNPKQAKRLAVTLANSVDQYESKVGRINLGIPSAEGSME